MPRASNLRGFTVGRWTVIARHGTCPKSLQATWVIECDCGYLEVQLAGEIKRRGSLSACPECRRKAAGDLNRTHGESKNYLHSAWRAMRRRCDPGNTQSYSRYAGRGITVYEPWSDYPTFASYVRQNLGERPTPDHSLDRADNNEGYKPGNIRWATRREQAANKRPRVGPAPRGWKWPEHKKGPRKLKKN